MGVQTMSSHSHGDDARRGLPLPLPRQGSVYGLTLTEVETQLGEPLRTMNLDDLLRTVLPAAPAPNAAKKTVDEVWRDIQSAGARGGGARQPSMGEMTLEDFLSRAGVAVDTAPHWMHQYPPQQQYALQLGAAAPGPGPALDAAYRDRPVGVFLSNSHSQVAGRKRGAAAAVPGDGVVERTVERRQKRMIKNRESAARSRARKQAYTNELENKIARLEEENERLRKLKLDETKKMEPNEEHVHSLDSSIHPQFHSKSLSPNVGTTGATTGAARAAAIAATGEEAAPPPPPANEFRQFLMRRPWAGRPYMFIVKLSRASN